MRNDMQNSLIEALIRVAGVEAEPMLQLQKLEVKKGEAELFTYFCMSYPLIFLRAAL